MVSKDIGKGLSLEEMSVVQEFSNMLPKELLGLVPKRELEFIIKLEPRTALISKALYRMATTKL